MLTIVTPVIKRERNDNRALQSTHSASRHCSPAAFVNGSVNLTLPGKKEILLCFKIFISTFPSHAKLLPRTDASALQ